MPRHNVPRPNKENESGYQKDLKVISTPLVFRERAEFIIIANVASWL